MRGVPVDVAIGQPQRRAGSRYRITHFLSLKGHAGHGEWQELVARSSTDKAIRIALGKGGKPASCVEIINNVAGVGVEKSQFSSREHSSIIAGNHDRAITIERS